jgi:NitT/TauT family transport system substrate-binding protein
VNEHIHSVNEEMSLEILAFGVEQLKPLCLPGEMAAEDLGQMTAERWETLAGQLRSLDLLSDSVRASDAYYLGGLSSPAVD